MKGQIEWPDISKERYLQLAALRTGACKEFVKDIL
jgi:hypothetical protein